MTSETGALLVKNIDASRRIAQNNFPGFEVAHGMQISDQGDKITHDYVVGRHHRARDAVLDDAGQFFVVCSTPALSALQIYAADLIAIRAMAGAARRAIQTGA